MFFNFNRKAILFFALLLGVCGLIAFQWFRPVDVMVAEVQQRDFIQSVVASGRVQNPNRMEVGTQIVGVVSRVPVVEGQMVAEGQTLIELNSSELQAGLLQAQAAVAQARLKLRQTLEVQAPVSEQAFLQAAANHEVALLALKRSQRLFEKGFVGQAQLDDITRTEKVAQAQLLSAQRQFLSTRAGGSEIALAQSALEQALANAELAQVRLSYARLQTPVAGVLISRNVEPGDLAQPGKVLMTVSPAGDTQLVVQIDEKNLGLVSLGQKAKASADAFPAQRFDAEMSFINPGVDAQRGSVEVKLRVPEPPAYLKQDMTVSVEIEVARRPAALVLPTDALHDFNTALPWVFKVVNGKAEKTPVTLGLKSASNCEVLTGLASGDKVVIHAEKSLKNLLRVRSIPPPIAAQPMSARVVEAGAA